MHDEVLMRVMDRGTNGLKQAQTRRNIEPVRVAERVHGDAVDVFHDDVRGAVRQRAAVQEMRNVGVIELGEDLTLDLEPRLDSAGERAAEYHFDGYLLLELGVRTFGKVNFPHAAHTQGAQHSIRPYAVSFHCSKHAPRCRSTANVAGSCSRVLLECM